MNANSRDVHKPLSGAERAALKKAVRAGLQELAPAPRLQPVVQLAWKRGGDGDSWSGVYESHEGLAVDWDRGVDWRKISADLDSALHEEHIEHLDLVGDTISGRFRLTAADMVKIAVATLWDRHSSLELADSAIEQLVEEFSGFFGSLVIRLSFVAPLMNLKCELRDGVPVGDDIVMRRLTDDEVSQVYAMLGDSIISVFQMPEWACVGTITAKKNIGNDEGRSDRSLSNLQNILDRIVLGLRTFQDGPVGYNMIWFQRETACPIPSGMSGHTLGHEYIPFGNYTLDGTRVDDLRRHINQVQRELHQALESACSRLASASIRLNDRDKLIDLVIGMEALLLASLANEKYRGELRFRFALHYALLQEQAVRNHAYKRARDLYDLRSSLAHGGPIPDTVRFGQEATAFAVVVSEATKMLRQTIKQSLADAPTFAAARPEFWEAKYFPEGPLK